MALSKSDHPPPTSMPPLQGPFRCSSNCYLGQGASVWLPASFPETRTREPASETWKTEACKAVALPRLRGGFCRWHVKHKSSLQRRKGNFHGAMYFPSSSTGVPPGAARRSPLSDLKAVKSGPTGFRKQEQKRQPPRLPSQGGGRCQGLAGHRSSLQHSETKFSP